MGYKLPPLSVDDVIDWIEEPTWAVYVYFGGPTDEGWTNALTMEGLFARLIVFLCEDEAAAEALMEYADLDLGGAGLDPEDIAAIAWGFGSSPEVVGLTYDEAASFQTATAIVITVLGTP